MLPTSDCGSLNRYFVFEHFQISFTYLLMKFPWKCLSKTKLREKINSKENEKKTIHRILCTNYEFHTHRGRGRDANVYLAHFKNYSPKSCIHEIPEIPRNSFIFFTNKCLCIILSLFGPINKCNLWTAVRLWSTCYVHRCRCNEWNIYIYIKIEI